MSFLAGMLGAFVYFATDSFPAGGAAFILGIMLDILNDKLSEIARRG